MPQEQIIRIQVERAVPRLDHLLANSIPELSRSQLQKLIRQGKVVLSHSGTDTGIETLAGEKEQSHQVVRANTAVRPGDIITLHLPFPQPSVLESEAMALDIIFEDDDLIVINKPAGLVVHPASGHAGGTLVNALLARYPDLITMTGADKDSAQRPGIVHRLDRDTSGLIVVARTPAALQHLRQQFKARTVEKSYLALVFGQPPAPAGVIDVPLGRDPHHRQRFAPRPDGKPARTHYHLLETLGQYSLLAVILETGRTHQIRVHLAWLKCPVVGDHVYGYKKSLPPELNQLGLNRQFLHAWRLCLQHPRTGQPLTLEAPLENRLEAVLDRMRR